ncbi:DegT/DnrJ/EryC1/StrS family aminotransferase [Phenylobacterium sp. 20VBR1]|uniref:DegT/DnrJ/EryC1/StrS family aminotransferase n=1 Tax=Phenylobacterium glaciei TaxID=2803784 RepID=A0A941D0C0_9CAUL|nr:DegT/DnrJ/EryC1/StrS family aminotransferase [Phenylobacterium glaciei]MBR7619177.1 DegT/DnrJ/EryC1/StrS family aminotransferase [Phenylobacterium glaciei]
MRTAANAKLPTTAPGNLPVARPRLPSADDILPYLRRIDDARWYSNFGPLLTELELRLASRFTDGAVASTVVNATQALTLTLQAMDLPAGSLVATPSWTFVATAHAIAQAGLTPWFLDVDHASQMLDPALVREMLARAPGKVSAVLPVAAHGAMPDIEAWLAFRDETGLAVLLDAAAAFDAARDARLPTVVSLHATKVLGLGEGGFLVTDDAALAFRVRRMTTYGFNGTREAQIPGTNAKLSEYTAAVGLAALDRWPADRLRFFLAAQHTRIGLAMTPSASLQSGWGSDWVTSVCVVRLPEGCADPATEALLGHGVETRRWWGDGCHLSAAFAGYPRTDLPVTERLSRSVIGLPFAIDLAREDVDRVVLALRTTPGIA